MNIFCHLNAYTPLSKMFKLILKILSLLSIKIAYVKNVFV